MKKEYVQPIIEEEKFVANEYIAACWSIACNFPYGYGYFEKNGIPGYQKGEDEYITSGYGCDKKHEANGIDAAGPAANAMWQEVEWGKDNGDPYGVFYFKAKGHWGTSNHHFCTLDSVNWEKNPNASN